MRIAVLTDVHANLPALEAALAAIQGEGCDAIYHLGDAIAIGPYPAETLRLLLATPGVHCLMGNHDEWFVHGLPQPQPEWMSDGEVAHQHWTHAQLDPAWRGSLAAWPLVMEESLAGMRVVLLHYPRTGPNGEFAPAQRDPAPADLDNLFAAHPADLILFGHQHGALDLFGRARYINPGSLGCQPTASAPFCLVTLQAGRYTVEHRAAPYDDSSLWPAFSERQVPEREFLNRVFFGGRLA